MHEITIRVRWGELDPYHHVNHAVYLSYLETGRIAALQSAGLGMAELEHQGFMILVAEMRIRFRRPGHEGDELRVLTSTPEIKAASTRWRQEIRRGDELLLEAEVVGAITDLTGRPRRVPEELRLALGTIGGAE